MIPALTLHLDAIRLFLSRGPVTSRQLQEKLGLSQPTLSRALLKLGEEVVRLGAARSIHYLLRDRGRGFGDIPIYRVGTDGQIGRLGLLIPVRPEGYVMRRDDGKTLHSEGIPWWLLDMRPQGFLGRAYAARHAAGLGLPSGINQWNDSDALRALLIHGHDAVGNLLLGDRARDHFLGTPPVAPVHQSDKVTEYVRLARLATQGDTPVSSAGGEQPKFTVCADTPEGSRQLLVKFSLPDPNPITERWRDLLLAEHHALETLASAGISAARSWVLDQKGQRFLEVERFDRVGRNGRRGLFSLSALDAEFIGSAQSPWPLLVERLAAQRVVTEDSVKATQILFAFGRLIGNSDMHAGNLSFVSERGRPYALAPAYDMLPMAFAPRSGGGLSNLLPALELHPGVAQEVWPTMLALARDYVSRLRGDGRFSGHFRPCLDALDSHLDDSARRIERLG